MAFPLVVLDASAALALLLADEEGSEIAKVVENTINLNGQLFVPGIFWYELGNGMLSADTAMRATSNWRCGIRRRWQPATPISSS